MKKKIFRVKFVPFSGGARSTFFWVDAGDSGTGTLEERPILTNGQRGAPRRLMMLIVRTLLCRALSIRQQYVLNGKDGERLKPLLSSQRQGIWKDIYASKLVARGAPSNVRLQSVHIPLDVVLELDIGEGRYCDDRMNDQSILELFELHQELQTRWNGSIEESVSACGSVGKKERESKIRSCPRICADDEFSERIRIAIEDRKYMSASGAGHQLRIDSEALRRRLAVLPETKKRKCVRTKYLLDEIGRRKFFEINRGRLSQISDELGCHQSELMEAESSEFYELGDDFYGALQRNYKWEAVRSSLGDAGWGPISFIKIDELLSCKRDVELQAYSGLSGQDLEQYVTRREASSDVDIMVFHDGAELPSGIFPEENARNDKYIQRHQKQRDWGAYFIALAVAKRLGSDGVFLQRLSRSVSDQNRFAGVTPKNARHTETLSCPASFSDKPDTVAQVMGCSYAETSRLLEKHFNARLEETKDSDAAKRSSGDPTTLGREILCIHTYDKFNKSGDSERPEVTSVFRPEVIQADTPLHELYDPLFPRSIATSTAHLTLVHLLSSEFALQRLFVDPNLPYTLPSGSFELRLRNWLWFSYIQHRYETQHQEAQGEDASEMAIWRFLKNVNNRDVNAHVLRLILRGSLDSKSSSKADANTNDLITMNADTLRKYRREYGAIEKFLKEENENGELENSFRMSTRTPSVLTIEIRKDLLFESLGDQPLRSGEDLKGQLCTAKVDQISYCIAAAVKKYRSLRDKEYEEV